MKVTLVCIVKNEDNYILEWINYHLKLGFDDVFIYENNWVSNLKLENVYTITLDGETKKQISQKLTKHKIIQKDLDGNFIKE
jgi:hypothetical protein